MISELLSKKTKGVYIVMKILDLNNRSRTKWVNPLSVISFILSTFWLAYGLYLQIPIEIDESIVNEDRLELIAVNYEKLLETDMFGDPSMPGVFPISGQVIRAVNEDPRYSVNIHVHDEGVEPEIYSFVERLEGFMGSHERPTLFEIHIGEGKWGDRKSYFYASSKHCDILMECWESDGTTKAFEEMMNEIMSIVTAN